MHKSLTVVPLLVSAVVAQSATWHRMPNRSAGRATLAYDEARERMVLVEEHANESLRTFELVGGVWTLRDSRLGARRLFETTYDPVRRRVVLFGGERWPWTLTDAWEWDGRAWRGLPSFPHSNDGQRTLVFDPATGSCLIHANMAYGPPPPIQTFLLQGNGWTQVASGGPSAGQGGFVAAGDPIRRRTVLFTNSMWGTPQRTSLTWEWDGTAWAQLAPAVQPSLRFAPSLCFVPNRQRVLLFGGMTLSNSELDDLWEWDGVTWTPAGRTGMPMAGAAMAHDTRRDRTVFAGGVGPQSSTIDSWEWDGANVRVISTAGSSPSGSAVMDTARGRLVVFERSRVREWDGMRWHGGFPAIPGGGAAAYDPIRARTVLAGGTATHEWDGVNWTTHAGAGAYGPVVFDTSRGRVLMLDGQTGLLLEWNGTQWSQIPASGTAPRFGVGVPIAYDAARSRLVVCTVLVDVNLRAIGFDTHEWDGTTWLQMAPSVSPPPRMQFALAYDGMRRAVLLFGGTSDPGFPTNDGDAWAWDGTTWSQAVAPNSPYARVGATLVFDPLAQRMLLLGGHHYDSQLLTTTYGDLWSLDTMPSFVARSLGAGCGGLAGAPALATSFAHPGADAFTIDLLGAPPSAPALFGIGLASGNVPLGSGCMLFVPQAVGILFAPANAAGFASVRTSIPASALGFSFVVQAAALDPQAPLGFALTEGLRSTIGF